MDKRRHYHVLVGLAGLYLPDANYYCRTLKEAQMIAAEEVRGAREAYGTKWVGSVYRHRYAEDGVHMVCISECYETDCREEDNVM